LADPRVTETIFYQQNAERVEDRHFREYRNSYGGN